MSRRDRRKFRSDARRYLKNTLDGSMTVAAAARWLGTLPICGQLTDSERRRIVIDLRADDLADFVASEPSSDDPSGSIRLAEPDGSVLSPLTLLRAMSRL